MRPLNNTPPLPSLPGLHRSLTCQIQHPLTPTHIKARANQAATCFLRGKSYKKKEHMKEAQSPKNVESGENLYRCDPRTDHRGAVCIYP